MAYMVGVWKTPNKLYIYFECLNRLFIRLTPLMLFQTVFSLLIYTLLNHFTLTITFANSALQAQKQGFQILIGSSKLA